MAGPNHVSTSPGQFFASGIALRSCRRCSTSTVMRQDTEVITTPLKRAKNIIPEIRNLQILSQALRAYHARLLKGAVLVITGNREQHFVLYYAELFCRF